MIAFLAGFLVLTSFGQTNLDQWRQLQCQGRAIYKRYFNYAEGFSLAIPSSFKGRAGQAAGPERGVSIPLSHDCTGVIVVYGEPNSAEYQMPADAVQQQVDWAVESDPDAEIQRYNTQLGRLEAAGVTIRHRKTFEVKDVVVAFRPGGTPVYTAILSTTGRRYEKDRDLFRKVLRGFRLEAWR
jgi:hypothetical protein